MKREQLMETAALRPNWAALRPMRPLFAAFRTTS